jgi:hypothetical protein
VVEVAVTSTYIPLELQGRDHIALSKRALRCKSLCGGKTHSNKPMVLHEVMISEPITI